MRIVSVIYFLLFSIYMYSQEAKMYPCRTQCNIGIQIADYKAGDSITIDGLLKAGKIKAEAGNFAILSYKITMDGYGFSDLIEINNPGEKFTEKTIFQFRKLRRGTFLTIDCVTAKDGNGFITGMKPTFYLIR